MQAEAAAVVQIRRAASSTDPDRGMVMETFTFVPAHSRDGSGSPRP